MRSIALPTIEKLMRIPAAMPDQNSDRNGLPSFLFTVAPDHLVDQLWGEF
ncbi:hypothetical protein WNZ14_08485 [Hoeflea sp. AS60]